MHNALKVICLVAFICPAMLHAQTVLRTPRTSQPLAERWQWALQKLRQSDCSGGCWIGYSIRRRMDRHAYIGGWNSEAENRKTLAELIYGKRAAPSVPAGAAVGKEVAFLFRLKPSAHEINDVRVSNLSRPADLDAVPLLWLGRATDAQSICLLKQIYQHARRVDVKKDLTMALGLHDAPTRIVPFLGKVLTGTAASEVREAAAFWLGQQDSPKALALLKRAVRSDASQDVREKAVFAVSLMRQAQATDALIDLAKGANNRGVRGKAIFWLAQRASKKAVAALEDVAQADADTEIRKKAVFALSRLPADQAIPRLINIARTNPNPDVRKQAIFWLGQSGDPRAVRALAAIARGSEPVQH